jgi:hypothetical protein
MPMHRKILYNHLWQEHLDRGANLEPLGPDHYPSWEVIVEMLYE